MRSSCVPRVSAAPSRWCSATWTTSRTSTTASATSRATTCSASSPPCFGTPFARSTSRPAGAAQLAERARTALERRTILTQDGESIHVTASFGVAAHPDHGSGDDLLAAADAALYEAKRRGKNRVLTAPADRGVREGFYRS